MAAVTFGLASPASRSMKAEGASHGGCLHEEIRQITVGVFGGVETGRVEKVDQVACRLILRLLALVK